MVEKNHRAENPGDRRLSAVIAAHTRWGSIWAVFGAGLICGAYMTKVAPALPLQRVELGLTLVESGFIATTFNVTGGLIGILAGTMCDRYGHRRLGLAGLAILALSGLLGAGAWNFPLLLASRFFEGIGFILFTVSGSALIATAASDPRDRAKALGLWAATNERGSAAAAFAAAATYALPVFWVGQLLVLGLGFELRWFPLSGLSDPRPVEEGWKAWLDVGWHAVLPVMTLALQQAAFFVTIVLAKARLELALGYVRALRARGISEGAIVWRHVGRNVAPQIIVAVFNRVGMLFTGAVLVETLFAWPGLGRLLGSAILNRDHPVLLGVFALVTAAVIVSNGLGDVLHARLDPRIGADREAT